ncbi:MAG: SBBP repeat-containing protein, partial [Thermocrinis sp.]|nr:SBBP repeat-containing protein [Thermocrinis sp.]
VAKADPSLPIVIDPILQATYLGGSGYDNAYTLAIHPQTGEVYVAGYTKSTDFPGIIDGAQEECDNWIINLTCYDVFVARLNKDLTQILQSTYLGGGGNDKAEALAIHPKTGEVYVAGDTSSKNFPKTAGGAQAILGGRYYDHDAFVARLNKELTQILQSTYLGGSSFDSASALAIHPTTGEVYVAGVTSSENFPKTIGGAQANKSGDADVFVARLSSDLTKILQSTYLGGNQWDEASSLAIHPHTGEIYVAGYTRSSNFPKTTGGAQTVHRGELENAFVARLNQGLTRILQSTYLGGSGNDEANALAIHPKTGEVYVVGDTSSKNFPKTAGSAQARFGGGDYDSFVARLNKELTKILQSTYLGGSGDDGANALVIHPKTGEVYVAGYTRSSNFPKTAGGAQANKSGGSNAFVARLNKELTKIIQSTYLGGSGNDNAHALAIHPQTGEIYVAGYTTSTNFPKTACGAQTNCNKCIASEYSGSGDAFVARLSADLSAGNGSSSGGSGGGGTCGHPMSGSKSPKVSLPFVAARRIRKRRNP